MKFWSLTVSPIRRIATLAALVAAFVFTSSAFAGFTPVLSINSLTGGSENGTGSVTDATFEVSIDGGLINVELFPITGLLTLSGTAQAGTDYVSVTSFSIAVGQNAVLITVPVVEDINLENTESLIATISVPVIGSINPLNGSSVASIIDDDLAALTISVGSALDGAETATPTNAQFTIGNDLAGLNETGVPITGNLALSGTSTAGTDYTDVTSFSIANNQSSVDVVVPVLNDVEIENTETLIATISAPSVGAINTGASVASITDDDASLLTLSIAAGADGVEGAVPTAATFVVNLDAGLINSTGVPITGTLVLSGDGVAGSDYTDVTTFSIADGASSAVVSVAILNDASVELSETITATISTPSIGVISALDNATVNIIDDDATALTLSIVQSADGVESATPSAAAFLVSLDAGVINATGVPITGTLALTGTATAGDDYTDVTSFSIADGASDATVLVNVLNDAALESAETIVATISGPSLGVVSVANSAVASIIDDDAAALTISIATTTDGVEGTSPTNATFTVSLDGALTNATGVPITGVVVLSGSATVADGDIADVTAFSIANGSSTAILTVPVLNDNRVENLESVIATISAPTLGAISAAEKAQANILDDDAAALTLSIAATSDGAESVTPTNAVFTVSLDGALINATGVPITGAVSLGGTASVIDGDVVDVTTFSIADGGNTAIVTVPVLDDTNVESTETLVATISAPTLGVVSAADNAVANITDDDAAALSLSIVATSDGVEGTTPTNATFTVSLDGAVTNTTGLPISGIVTLSGSASAANGDIVDVTAFSIANGANTALITVPVLDDTNVENPETLIATISAPTLGVISGLDNAVVNITDDDAAGLTLSIASSVDGVEGVSPTNAVFTVSLDGALTNSTGVPITGVVSLAGTATVADGDITDVTAFSIADGDSVALITVPVLDDTNVENPETVIATISAPTLGVVSAADNALANITDDDAIGLTLSIAATGDGAESVTPTNATFTVSLDGAVINTTGVPITGTVALSGTASAINGDITDVSSFSIADGGNTVIVSVPVLDDTNVENTETLIATISAPTLGVVSAADNAVASITDDDAAALTVSIVSTVDGIEAASPTDAVFTVTLDGAVTNSTGVPITGLVALTGTATVADGDITDVTSFSIADGDSTAVVTVPVLDDSSVENIESLVATISAPSLGAISASNSALSSITDDDAAALTLSIAAGSDGVEGVTPTNATFIVSLDGAVSNATGVPITGVVNLTGTATVADGDISDVTAFSIVDGDTSVTITVPVLDDGSIENIETVIATISAPSLGVISAVDNAVVNITDDDAAALTLSIAATTDGAEGATPVDATFTVSLDGAVTNTTGLPITGVVMLSGTASVADGDISDVTAFSIADGDTSAVITIPVLDDAQVENPETIIATISAPTLGAISALDNAVATITDDDASALTVSIVATTDGAEGATPTNATFTVSLDDAVTNATGVPISGVVSLSGTASVANGDIVDVTAFSIADGDSSVTLSIPVLDDANVENPETVVATISAATLGVVSAVDNAVVNITDDDATNLTLSIAATTDGAEGATPTNATFTVSMDGAVINDTGVPITGSVVLSGTASVADGDINDVTTFSIADGDSSATIAVVVLDDTRVESTETIIATISAPTLGVVSAVDSAVASITDDDAAVLTLSITATTDGAESTTPTDAVFTVSLDGAVSNSTGAPITGVVTLTGTASAADGDITDISAFSIADGASSTTITVAVLDDDNIENTETVIATISVPTLGTVGAVDTATVSITDDDIGSVVVSIAPGDAGFEGATPTDASFAVNLDSGLINATGVPITGTVALSGNATAGVDYTDITTFSIPDGAGSGAVTVAVLDDLEVELNEDLVATISAPSLGSVSVNDTATVIINDDDSAVLTLSITPTTDGNESVIPVDAQFTVSMDGGLINSTGTTIDGTLSLSGTATSGSDFTDVSNFSIANGESSVIINVPIIDDVHVELTETLIATISAPIIGAVSATNTATVIINDDDAGRLKISIASSSDGFESATPTSAGFIVSMDGSGNNQTGAPITGTVALSGAAQAGADYVDVSSFSIPENARSTIVSVNVLDDVEIELDESIIATISAPSIGEISSVNTATVNVIDDEAANAMLSIVQVSDGAEGGADAEFMISFDDANAVNGTGADITGTLSLSGTATAGEDFIDVTGFAIAEGLGSVSVQVIIINDNLVEPDETLIATLSAPSIGTISSVNVATAVIASEDTAGFAVTPLTAVNLIEGSTNANAFNVVLTGQPLSNVVVQVASDNAAALVDTPTLLFTTANWNTPQAVSLSAFNDANNVSETNISINFSIDAANSDDAFDSLSSAARVVNVTDTDAPNIIILDSNGSTVFEGSEDTFDVRLTVQPSSDVVLQVSSSDTTALTATPATLTFTNSTWDTPQTVNLSALEDADRDDEAVTVTVAVDAALSDDVYDSAPSAVVNAIVVELTTDTDADGLPDALEASIGSNPIDPNDPTPNGSGDDDNDSVTNAVEEYLANNGGSADTTPGTDTDLDGIPDALEIATASNPFDANSPTPGGDNDDDADGIPNGLEAYLADNGGAADTTHATDTDGDGLPDVLEISIGSDFTDANDPTLNGDGDDDGDGIPNGLEEYLRNNGGSADTHTGTDTDGDGLPDILEIAIGSDFTDPDNPTINGAGDDDMDGIPNALEAYLAANGGAADTTHATDTDGDGLPDVLEIFIGSDFTDPDDPYVNGDGDDDGDGIPNGLEAYLADNGGAADTEPGTDTDGDGIPDVLEIRNGTDFTDPNDPTPNGDSDDDGDGIPNGLEQYLNDNGGAPDTGPGTDTDGDGIPDNLEIASGSDPFDADSPVVNGDGDDDGDGIPNGLEDYLANHGGSADTTPGTDTDGDGLPDVLEIAIGSDFTDPNDPTLNGDGDDDMDGIPNGLEAYLAANGGAADTTFATDTDGDGIPDVLEISIGSDFTDPDDPYINGNGDDDMDGIPNGLEAYLADNGGAADTTHGTDTDGDGIPDVIEISTGSDFTDANDPTINGDSDDDVDSIANGLEVYLADNGGAADTATSTDTDGDGLPDVLEIRIGSDFTDPNDPYTNGDSDDDADTITNGLEDYLSENGGSVDTMLATDTDQDGLPDVLEISNDSDFNDANDPLFNGNGDDDGDGISNGLEAYLRDNGGAQDTTPQTDTDMDGVPDYIEVLEGSNPFDRADFIDNDNDLVPDFVEQVEGSDPNDGTDFLDSDGDGVPDSVERRDGTNSRNRDDYIDSDRGGAPDYVEMVLIPNSGLPLLSGSDGSDDAQDSDGDHLPDVLELRNGSDPLSQDHPTPGGNLDSDGDGVVDAVEAYLMELRVDDVSAETDTDRDGYPAAFEVENLMDPLSANDRDSDGDSVPDVVEAIVGIDVDGGTDTDADGLPDALEVALGAEPSDANFPVMNGNTDSDNDGITDAVEGHLVDKGGSPDTTPTTDTDGDMVPDMDEIASGSDSFTKNGPVIWIQTEQRPSGAGIVDPKAGFVESTAYVGGSQAQTLTYNWSRTDAAVLALAVSQTDTRKVLEFDPASLPDGLYTLSVDVVRTVAGVSTPVSSVDYLVRFVNGEVVQDSDNDGISDAVDTLDGDFGLANQIQTVANDASQLVMQSTPGTKLILGTISIAADKEATRVTQQDIINFGNGSGGPDALGDAPEFSHPNGLFDFQVANLKETGDRVTVIIPVEPVIPENAEYQKFIPGVGYQPFDTSTGDTFSSAPAVMGMCPPPGDQSYQPGLTTGDSCIELTLSDGGPNDADGEENGLVVDPGGTCIPGQVILPPVDPVLPELPPAPLVTGTDGIGGGGAVGFCTLLLLMMAGLRRQLLSVHRSAFVVVACVAAAGTLFSISAPVHAEQGQWYVGAGVGVSQFDPDYYQSTIRVTDDSDTGIQGLFGYDLTDHWSVEGFYADPGQLETDFPGSIQYTKAYGLGGMYSFFNGGTKPGLSAFVGAGINELDVDSSEVPFLQDNSAQYYYALGARYLTRSGFAARVEYKEFSGDANMISLNVVKRFGEFLSASESIGLPLAIDLDQDNDGVLNANDLCPNTATGAVVSVDGCDKIVVAQATVDPCVVNPNGQRIDGSECNPDRDFDGVQNRADQCPQTPQNIVVNEQGCAPFEGRFPGIQFAYKSEALNLEARAILDIVVDSLRNNPLITLEIGAHTDVIGNPRYNMRLSLRRAQSVVDYLIANGIDRSRLIARGFGEMQPVASNETEEGRAMNRRVEMSAK